MKNSNDTIGNQTRDLPVVTQYLNQLHHCMPPYYEVLLNYFSSHKTTYWSVKWTGEWPGMLYADLCVFLFGINLNVHAKHKQLRPSTATNGI